MGCVYYRYEKGLRGGKRQRRISHALTIFWPPTDHRQWFLLPVVVFIVDTLFYIACVRCSIVVQNQQKIAVYHRIACRVVVLRLNTYFQLRYFIFCTTKIAVLSFVFFGRAVRFFHLSWGSFFAMLNYDSWAMLNSAKLLLNISCASLAFCIR